jgi:HrpA-like RNA helicase
MDFSFVALKNLMNQRKLEKKSTAKLIIMSATLDSQ